MDEQQHYLVKITAHVAEHVTNIDNIGEGKMSEEQSVLVGKISAAAVIAAMASGLSEEADAVEKIIAGLTRDVVEERLQAHRSSNVTVFTPKVKRGENQPK